MYEDTFGLKERPFRSTLDPAFFYFSMDHRQALIRVGQSIRDRCGLVLLLGEAGTGKTTICYHIHEHDKYLCTYLNNPYVTEIEFLEEVNRGLRVPVGVGSTRFLLNELESHLLRQHYRGKPAVLIVDEAHRFGLPILDQILTLSNLQVPRAHLLQIILAGNPLLLDTLRQPQLKSLSQRIGVRCHLGRLDHAGTIDYINFRLAQAGCTEHSPFTAKALNTIWKASRGTPRLINQLSDRALHEANYKGKKKVGEREVQQVVNDPLYQPLFTSREKSWSIRTAFAGTALALCVGVSLGLWYFGIGSKFLAERETGLRHVPIEHRSFIKKPITISRLAAEGGDLPANMEAVVEGGTLPIVVSSEPERVRPESQTSRTTHTAVILDPIGELPGSSSELLATGDEPALRLSAIAWDEDPARCIAVVNDKIVHEGDFLGELRVLRINHDHIVLIQGNEHIIKSIHTRSEDPNSESNAVKPSAEEHASEVSELSNQRNAERSLPLRDFSSIINFDYRTFQLQHQAHEELDRVVSLAKQRPNHAILIFGHTDDVGSNNYNQWLSKSRAEMVGGYLVEKEIDPERITTIGVGEKNPLMSNTTPEGRAANRRVEIKLVPVEEDSDLLPGG